MSSIPTSLQLFSRESKQAREVAQVRLAMIAESAYRLSETTTLPSEANLPSIRACRRVADFLRELRGQISGSAVTAHDARSHAVVLMLVIAEENLARHDAELHEAIQVTAQSCLNYARLLDELESNSADDSVIQFCISQMEAVIDFLGRGERKITPQKNLLTAELIA